MEEIKIKTKCLEDLSIAMEIIGKSNHSEKDKIISSLETIDEFCDRWWEV